jgi:hypothetical protein
MLHKDPGFNCENIIRVKMLNKELPFMRNVNEWKKREVAVVIALLTVSVQSYKVTTRNPVEALRYE